MAFSPEKRAGTINGIIFVAIFAAAATMVANIESVSSLGISPLVVGIVIGIFYANTLHNQIPSAWESGIVFSGKKILRFAIVFYGFRITFQQIAEVGMDGFLVSLIMLSTTFFLGTYLGIKIFKMDRDTSMLTASGAAVCGAAAVLATEPVLKSQEHKMTYAFVFSLTEAGVVGRTARWVLFVVALLAVGDSAEVDPNDKKASVLDGSLPEGLDQQV